MIGAKKVKVFVVQIFNEDDAKPRVYGESLSKEHAESLVNVLRCSGVNAKVIRLDLLAKEIISRLAFVASIPSLLLDSFAL